MPWAPSRAGCRPPDEQPGAGDSSSGGPRAAQVGKCMESTCPYTEPTDLLPDTPELPDGVDAPAIRVDFMLGNDIFRQRVAEDGAMARVAAGLAPAVTAIPAAHVVRSGETATMPGHYPSRVEWKSAGDSLLATT